MDEEEEINSLKKELAWLLEEQVQEDLVDIQHTLRECSRRFPYRMGFDDRTVVKPQRNLLSSPSNIGQVKCVVTLMGDTLCDADISFRHKSGKDNHIFKTKFGADGQWILQQIRDAANHLAGALAIFHNHGDDHTFTSSKEVLMVLDNIQKLLTAGRSCLSFPQRKTIEDLIRSTSMQSFQPALPGDVAVSFYVHSAKLVLAIYHLHQASSYIEIVSKHQVECTVQWINEAIVLFTVAIQQCQHLADKVRAVEIPQHLNHS